MVPRLAQLSRSLTFGILGIKRLKTDSPHIETGKVPPRPTAAVRHRSAEGRAAVLHRAVAREQERDARESMSQMGDIRPS
jgi:hypothetical protein